MKTPFAVFLLLLAGVPLAADQPDPILPDTLTWTNLPGNPLVRGAFVVGSETAEGTYLFRVEMKQGGRIPPHTHPDTRHTTVISGTLYAGFGEMFSDDALVKIPAGAVYIAPAGTPHFLFARDGDVVYQEAGFGPTAVEPVVQPAKQ